MLHCFINTSCLVIQMVGMICYLFHSGRKFFHYLRYQFDIAIRCIYTIKHLLYIALQLNGIGFDFHNNVAEQINELINSNNQSSHFIFCFYLNLGCKVTVVLFNTSYNTVQVTNCMFGWTKDCCYNH